MRREKRAFSVSWASWNRQKSPEIVLKFSKNWVLKFHFLFPGALKVARKTHSCNSIKILLDLSEILDVISYCSIKEMCCTNLFAAVRSCAFLFRKRYFLSGNGVFRMLYFVKLTELICILCIWHTFSCKIIKLVEMTARLRVVCVKLYINWLFYSGL